MDEGWLVGRRAVLGVVALLATVIPRDGDAGAPAGSHSRGAGCDLALGPRSSALGPPQIVYVDIHATGANDGTSWADAYIDLKTALLAAGGNQQIWVADGTYTPAPPGGPRFESFVLVAGVEVYGGFAGGESSLSERDPTANVAILSGDLNGNDPDLGDNSFHVVTSSAADAAVLDGFTITAGGSNDFGGGARLSGGTAGPVLANCVFISNRVLGAGIGGGGVAAVNSHPLLFNCSFLANSAREGGAIFISVNSTALVVNCIFYQNTAATFGGAVRNLSDDLTIVTCTIYQNSTTAPLPSGMGGGIFTAADPALTNCILWGNTDSTGMGTSAQIQGGTPVVSYSDVQGGWLGAGGNNIAADPLFANPAIGDLRLQAGSPCIDSADSTALPDDSADLDADGNILEPTPVDLDGNARLIDDPLTPDTGMPETPGAPVADMGAYEHLLDCNGNGVPDAIDISMGDSDDCNANQIPDECELAACSGNPACDDCNLNGVLDECDIAGGTSHDCNLNGVLDECDIYAGTSMDGDMDGVPDECALFTGGCGPGNND